MPLKKILEDLRSKGQDPEKLTLKAIKRYERDESRKKVANDIFEKAKEAKQDLEKNLQGVDEGLRELGIRIDQCSRHGFFVIRVAELKILYLLRALKHDLKDRNPLSLASNTRGLVEHTAAMAYAGNALEQLLEGLENQSSESRISQTLDKAEKTIESCYYGSSPKGSDPDKPKAPHINDCLKVLKEQPGLDEIGRDLWLPVRVRASEPPGATLSYLPESSGRGDWILPPSITRKRFRPSARDVFSASPTSLRFFLRDIRSHA